MKTNLIQNYISSKQPVYQAQHDLPKKDNIKKEAPHFDINKELNNRTFIKPLSGNGKLIKGNVFESPATLISDSVYKLKSLKNGFDGDANDHQLGKINDLGLVAGGLGIAAYLFTKKSTPLTKVMEFVGLGSFIAAMNVWPKIGIQLPTKLIHGVNVQKKYEDSYGRKKPFYQDPQFLPWDLHSDKQIHKIGNRLNVPKNIPNRREFIQEKMKKIAVQDNTLWMLTAGFATPIMSGLACSAVEGYINKVQIVNKNKAADAMNLDAEAMLDNLANDAAKFKDDSVISKLENVIELHRNKPIDNVVLKDINAVVTDGFDLVTAKAIKKDIQAILTNDKFIMKRNTIAELAKNIREALGTGFSKNIVDTITLSEESIAEIFEKNGFLSKNYDPAELKDIVNELKNPILDKANVHNAKEGAEQIDVNHVRNILIRDKNNQPINSALKKIHAASLDDNAQTFLRGIVKWTADFKAKNAVLDKYAYIKMERVLPDCWNDVQESLFKVLKFTDKEIQQTKFDRTIMYKVLRQKLEKAAANTVEYEKMVKEFAKVISHFEKEIKPNDIYDDLYNKISPDTKTKYSTAVDKLFDSSAAYLRSETVNMKHTAKAFAGEGEAVNGSLKQIQKAFVSEKLIGVKSTWMRLLNTMSYFRRIAEGQQVAIDERFVSREIREEMIEFGYRHLLQGHPSDDSVKFYFKRNPNPNMTDMDQVEIDKISGKPKYKYLGKAAEGLVDIPQDKTFYKNEMDLLYKDDIDKIMNKVLGDNGGLDKDLHQYRKQILELIGGDQYFAKQHHLAYDHPTKAGSLRKFLLTGVAPDEFFTNKGNQLFNTKKWLKMFGGMGIALVAVTVGAQFFFGRMKAPEATKKG